MAACRMQVARASSAPAAPAAAATATLTGCRGGCHGGGPLGFFVGFADFRRERDPGRSRDRRQGRRVL